MELTPENITPVSMVKNEEYWIHNVLRDALAIFPNYILLDTGSTDRTRQIAIDTAKMVNSGELLLIEENYGNDANRIGNGRNVLRSMVKTHWMFLIDGDEIWTMPQLLKLLAVEVPDNTAVVMAGSKNIEDVNGKLVRRKFDTANKDVLFCPDVRWKRTDYPFESHDLQGWLARQQVLYVPADDIFCWHVRHTRRSDKNKESYFRQEKYDYFRYSGEYEELPDGWLGATSFCNPYFGT